MCIVQYAGHMSGTLAAVRIFHFQMQFSDIKRFDLGNKKTIYPILGPLFIRPGAVRHELILLPCLMIYLYTYCYVYMFVYIFACMLVYVHDVYHDFRQERQDSRLSDTLSLLYNVSLLKQNNQFSI